MRYRRTKGFTLIELMITLLIAAVVLGVGVPNFQEFIANNRMAAATNDLVSVLHLARGEAVKRRANVTICASADWDNFAVSSCAGGGRLADGWILFVDCSAAAPCGPPNIQVDAFDLVLQGHGPMPEQIAARVTNDAPGAEFISYGATGFPRNAAGGGAGINNFQLCDQRGNHDTGGGIAAGRWIQISPTGRPQIYRDQAYVQGAQNPMNGC
jgi:type IV fimbrial biogenesis protein FimT